MVAAAAYLWCTQLTAPGQQVWALQLTAYGMAISSTAEPCMATICASAANIWAGAASATMPESIRIGTRRLHVGLRRPHNWLQLVRYCVVGATGYLINLGGHLVEDSGSGITKVFEHVGKKLVHGPTSTV